MYDLDNIEEDINRIAHLVFTEADTLYIDNGDVMDNGFYELCRDIFDDYSFNSFEFKEVWRIIEDNYL